MSEKIGTGIAGTTGESGSGGFSFSLGKIEPDLEAELAAKTDELLAAFEEPTAEQTAVAAGAVGAAAALGGALALALPLAFNVDPPEIALPAKSGSDADVEGDEETVEMFNALKESSDQQASMADAVFNTLEPILNGVPVGEDLGIYAAADAAIQAAGITDEPTMPPIPFDGTRVAPSIARMQLFDEFAYAFRRAGMAAGAEDPEAPSKIMAAYMCLAVEKFVRRAIIKVSLPDDNYIKLLSKLTEFGSETAKKSGLPDTELTAYVMQQGEGSGTSYIPGQYDLAAADLMLGIDVVPLLNFYGGIGRLRDYGDNFDHDGSDPVYRSDGTEAKMVNMDPILMLLENGINFV